MLIRYLFSFILLSTMLLANVGNFTIVNGDVNVLRNHKSIKAFSMFKLESKDIISTSKNGFAKIVFSDKTTITLGKNTNFKVQDYLFDDTKESKMNFKVTSGFFKVVTGKIGKIAKKRFKLKTRNATIGIRGTIFEGTTNDNGDFIKCDKGAINVCASGECKVVKEGKYTVVGNGKTPIAPKESKKDNSDKEKNITDNDKNIDKNIDKEEDSTNKQTNTTDEMLKTIKLQKYLDLLLVAQGAVVEAVKAANEANEAFNRIIEAKNNVSAYEISAYESAQLAADSAAQAASSAQREAAAAAQAASSELAAQNAQSAADDIHEMTTEVTKIKNLASDQIEVVNEQTGISIEKSENLHAVTQKMEEGDFSQNNGELLSEEAVIAKDKTLVASQSVLDYKNEAVTIENNAFSKLQEVNSAQKNATEHAEAAEKAADAAEKAKAAAAAAAAEAEAEEEPTPPGG